MSTAYPVEQLCLGTGKVIATFPSLTTACHGIGKQGYGGAMNGISKCCKGKAKSAYGYFWRFKGSKTLPEIKPASLSEMEILALIDVSWLLLLLLLFVVFF
jgi:hypothetical protein